MSDVLKDKWNQGHFDFLINNAGIKDIIGANTALGRIGEASDIGGVVASLCTYEMAWITGQRIEVSGGIAQ